MNIDDINIQYTYKKSLLTSHVSGQMFITFFIEISQLKIRLKNKHHNRTL